MLFKSKSLCYSISEAERRFLCWLAHIFSAGSDRRNISHKQGFNIGWSDFTQEEFKTNMYCVGEIYFIVVFPPPLLNDYGLGNQFAEVVHGQFCKDFLVDELHLFACRCSKPSVCLRSRKEVSIPQRMAYSRLIS